ncbi:MAG: MBL fold metallo-hydrolase [Desulfovibrio sp.]|uniref:MBL fold metallo-hydrolase n=1 Tax=Desulfovibrio sp. 7SRBS1 TaxID=3378064 RepID=UPI003B3EADC7
MKLTVLCDNNSIIDRYLLAEPGLSFYIEVDGKRILWDAGYSDAFIRNAERMGINLRELDELVLSHGHMDHTWGLDPLMRLYIEAAIEGLRLRRPRLSAHPDCFVSRGADHLPEIGSQHGPTKLTEQFMVNLTPKPFNLTDSVYFLGTIPRRFEFETMEPMGEIRQSGLSIPDMIPDDTALACKTSRGLVVITGCAHAGVCNTVEHAREVTGVDKVADIIGGTHLLDAPAERLEQTGEYLAKLNLEAFHPCHCTDLKAKIALSKYLPVVEVGVGLRLECV